MHIERMPTMRYIVVIGGIVLLFALLSAVSMWRAATKQDGPKRVQVLSTTAIATPTMWQWRVARNNSQFNQDYQISQGLITLVGAGTTGEIEEYEPEVVRVKLDDGRHLWIGVSDLGSAP